MVTSYSRFFFSLAVNCYQLSSPIAIFFSTHPKILSSFLTLYLLFTFLLSPPCSFLDLTLIFPSYAHPLCFLFMPFPLLSLFSSLHSIFFVIYFTFLVSLLFFALESYFFIFFLFFFLYFFRVFYFFSVQFSWWRRDSFSLCREFNYLEMHKIIRIQS